MSYHRIHNSILRVYHIFYHISVSVTFRTLLIPFWHINYGPSVDLCRSVLMSPIWKHPLHVLGKSLDVLVVEIQISFPPRAGIMAGIVYICLVVQPLIYVVTFHIMQIISFIRSTLVKFHFIHSITFFICSCVAMSFPVEGNGRGGRGLLCRGGTRLFFSSICSHYERYFVRGTWGHPKVWGARAP